MDNRPIAFFDSGIGGLSCVDALLRLLPDESLLYYGDTLHAPYGDKTLEELASYAERIGDFLTGQNVKLLVVACNTLSSLYIEQLRLRYRPLPVIGMVGVTARYIAGACQGRRLGVIATRGTVASGAYQRRIREAGFSDQVPALACPGFVPMIEAGICEGPELEALVGRTMDRFVAETGIDSLVLGCTHYPFIAGTIQNRYPALRLIDPAEILARAVRDRLAERDALAEPGAVSRRRFYASRLTGPFLETVRRVCGDENQRVEEKPLGET